MKAMGIPVWMPRVPHDEAEETVVIAEPVIESAPLPKQHQPPPSSVGPAQSINELLDNKQPSPPAKPKPASTAPRTDISAPDCSAMDWGVLRQAVNDCQLCELHRTRTQTVFGTGDQQADWMIIGEAPGANEDQQGQPFVGRAGQLLNNMLAAVGLPREAVYISNVLKCRPPNNRDPKPEESALCRGYLERQIALVNPAIIMVVGRIAAHNLLQVDTPLGRLRGTVHQLPGSDVPVIVSYHPAYLLRQPAEKRKAWQDLKLARDVMAQRRS